jgi:hypothetical protein
MNVRDQILKILRQGSESFTSSEVNFIVNRITTSLCIDEYVDISSNTQKASIISEMTRNAIAVKYTERLQAEGVRKRQEEAARIEEERLKRNRNYAERYERTRYSNRNDVDIVELFSRGVNRSNNGIDRDDLVQLLGDALNLSTYNHVKSAEFHQDDSCCRKTYSSNHEFWRDALDENLLEGIEINLRNFHLMQWLPLSPGRYYTSKAVRQRQEATQYVSGNREYLPLGKVAMFLGGIGSVRLGSRRLDSETIYLLGASSNGSSHQGIPVMVPEREYRKVISYLQRGGCLTNMEGHLRVFSANEALIQYDRQIPKYAIFVENISVIQPSERLLVSVGVTYTLRDSYRGSDKSWSFCSFDPIRDNVSSAVQWLEEYAFRHSGRVEILSDFDECYQHFGNDDVEFPVSKIVRDEVDRRKLDEYNRSNHFHINEGAFMTQFTNYGSVVNMGTNPKSYGPNFIHVEPPKNLSEAATEIQQLLNQLSANNCTSETDIIAAVHNEIKINPTLKARLVNALKAGGLEALKAIFNHPGFSIPAETVKGWLDAE